tara:strand:+ start:2033 stop:2830 length:798 start_codon:yes stop_codon:yes gene_type:complete
MNKNSEKITVELDQKQQDFLQRLGLAYLLNSKYGPSIKMLWARLVENRVPIFFGSFIICFVVASGMTMRLYTVDKYNNQFRVENAALKQELADCPCYAGSCEAEKIIVEFYKEKRGFNKAGIKQLTAVLTGEADPALRYGALEMTILHSAIHLEVSYPTLKKLIELGADPNAQVNSTDRVGNVRQDQKGNSVLVTLIRKGRWECALDLVADFPIDLNQKNNHGITPYDILKNIQRNRLESSLKEHPQISRLLEAVNPSTSVVNSK